MINRILSYTLLTCIVGVMIVGATLTEVHGSITVSFGKQPYEMLAYQIPAGALR